MNFHSMKIEDIYKELKTRYDGLSIKEVHDRLNIDGKNVIKQYVEKLIVELDSKLSLNHC